jgi:hypothetical protein
MTGMFRRWLLGLAILTGLAPAASAADIEVDLLLVLAIDVSRSIDEVEGQLQRQGYIEAISDQRVIDAIVSGPHQRIALCYIEWAGAHYQRVVIDWTLIDGPASARAFVERLAEAPRVSESWTAVGAALEFSGRKLVNNGFRATRRVIDVSGDGRNNHGPPDAPIRDALVAQGIVINGLPIMLGRTNFGRPPDDELDRYYEENVIGGPGSFLIVARSFEDFGKAVRTKLIKEVSGIAGYPQLASQPVRTRDPAD